MDQKSKKKSKYGGNKNTDKYDKDLRRIMKLNKQTVNQELVEGKIRTKKFDEECIVEDPERDSTCMERSAQIDSNFPESTQVAQPQSEAIINREIPESPPTIGAPSKKFTNLKNKTFIHNSTCPFTNRFVLKVWGWKYRKLSHREVAENKSNIKIRSMLWEYYRDRKRQSVGTILRKFIKSKYFEIEIFHSGYPQPTTITYTESEITTLNEHKTTEITQKIRYTDERLTLLKNKLHRIDKSPSPNKNTILEKIKNKIIKTEAKLLNYHNGINDSPEDNEDNI